VQRRHALWFFLLLVAPLLIGCGHPWKTVVQAKPNPFFNQRRFAVLPVSYENLMVGDTREVDYLSEKDGEKWQTWQADKKAINDIYTDQVIARAADAGIQVVRATGPQDSPFLLRPHITFIEPGFYTAIVNKSSEIKLTLKITDPSGLVLDEIQIHRVVASSGSLIGAAISDTMTSGGRLKQAGQDAGNVTGKYLQFRVEGNED
jgi:hypothetical protein